MKIGIPKERKNNENRVALPPTGVDELIREGHQVFVEYGAGLGSGIPDEGYQAVGGVLADQQTVWQADLILKVKEPLPEEYSFFRSGQLLFTYLHLAANKELAQVLMEKNVSALAYENVQLADGSLPLLAPMSEIAGRMAAQIGGQFLERPNGGKGILLGSVPGVKQGNVVIIGGGVAGTNAATIALGLGARVTILDIDLARLKKLDAQFQGQVQTLFSNTMNLEEVLKTADLVIGAVLLPGHKAPTLVTKEMVKSMPKDSVIVDIAIDQGGIFETEDRVTTHDNPTYRKEEVIHYAVANMPGAVPQTATYALSNATISYIRLLANHPFSEIIKTNSVLANAVNTHQGKLTLQAVAEDLSLPFTPLSSGK
ncbi:MULTISPECIES: alanine dehydrogenase [Enterococcus]|uniref:alanine dehydrogenase n=1 Tax=Enterococcus TaxID=1350 RepID=UPI0010F6DB17|nr:MULTISPECIES: alanine dehydrogenase [Enterococcus]KAF1300798.1 alanine dehydrogenase [Enterococcus sp. JM9B]